MHESPDLAEARNMIAIAIGAAVAIVVTDGPFTLWDSLAGVVLTVFLVTHVDAAHFAHSVSDTLLYAAVLSVCVLLVLGVGWSALFREALGERDKQPFDPFNAPDVWGIGVWVILFVGAAIGVRLLAKWRRAA